MLDKFQVSCFHSKDFFPHKARKYDEIYKSWSDDKAYQFIFELTKATNDHAIHPIGCAIDIAAFNSFTIGERRFLTAGIWDSKKHCFLTNHNGKPSAPYFAAFQYVVRNALDRTPPKARLNLTFHYQQQMEPYAHNAYEAWGAVPRHQSDLAKLGILGYEVADNRPPLQLADLYTYGWYNFCVNGYVKSNNTLINLAMTLLNKKENGLALFAHEDEIFSQAFFGLLQTVSEK